MLSGTNISTFSHGTFEDEFPFFLEVICHVSSLESNMCTCYM